MKIQVQLILVPAIILENTDFISSSCFEYGIDLHRGDSLPSRNSVHSAKECQKMCNDSNFCYYFTWLQNMNACFLKGMHGWEKRNSSGARVSISGPKRCSSADYLMGWRLMKNTHCGGEEISDLPEEPNKYKYIYDIWGYKNTKNSRKIDIFDCESECRMNDECECFMFNESNASCHFHYRDTLRLIKTKDTHSHNSYVKPSYWDNSICSNGDVSLKDDGTPFIFWDGQWSPICGHYFWDNMYGANLFCKGLGYQYGELNVSQKLYDVDSFRIGGCGVKDTWPECKSGCNDYQLGESCGNGNINDAGNGNRDARCDANHSHKLVIDCSGGHTSKSTSCLGVYECIQKTCKVTNLVKDKDWGYYSNEDGDCKLCEGYCMRDEKCQSVECGRDYCKWMASGKCDEVEDLIGTSSGDLMTCLKSLVNEDSYSDKPRLSFGSKPNVNGEINDNPLSDGSTVFEIQNLLYTLFAIYLLVAIIYFLNSIRKDWRNEGHCCWQIAIKLFKVACYTLAGILILTATLRYTKNEDSSTVQYKTFNNKVNDEYPTFSICFSSTSWHSLHNQLSDALIMKHAMNSEEYDQMLKGFEFERPIWKTQLGFSNFSSMNHESFDIKLASFLRIFGIQDAIRFESKDITKLKQFGYRRKVDETWPFYNGYQDPNMACFTRNSFDEMDLIRTVDLVWLDSEYFKRSRLLLYVYIHQIGQLTRHLGNPDFKIYGQELSLGFNNKINLKLSHTSILRRRENAKVPCNNELRDDDRRFREQVVDKVGCTPIYWKSLMSSDDKHIKFCNTTEQMYRVYLYLQNKEKIFPMYTQPCDYMKVSVGVVQQPYFADYVLLEIQYMDDNYQEFVNNRNFGFESLWSGIGGFIGMFLGYSFLQIPSSLEKIKCWISIRILKFKQEFK